MDKLRQVPFFILLLVFLLVGLLAAGCVLQNGPGSSLAPVGEIRIHDIQGCSHRSPFTGRVIDDLSGIVTRKVSNGFYMQDDQPDDQFCSSEAIFVFTSTFPEVLPGDRLLVSARVEEFQPGGVESENLTLTYLIPLEMKIVSSGNAIPASTLIGSGGISVPETTIEDDGFKDFDPILDGIDFFESLESMLVRIDAGVVVGPRNQYNEVVIIPSEGVAQNLISSTGGLIQQATDPNPERILLNLNQENREKIHVGATLTKPITGIMDYSYGNYKVNVFGIASFVNVDNPISTFDHRDDVLSVATYNVENLSRFDQARIIQLATDIDTILGHPDVLVLHEILDDSGTENDGVVSAVMMLDRLTELLESNGGVSYGYIDNPPENNQDGGIEGGNIRSVILYRMNSLSITNTNIGRMPENPARIGPDRWPFSVTRKPLVVLFDHDDTRFLVVAPHLTSRGADSPLFGIKQPNEKPEEEKRIAQAEFINEYLRNFRQRNPDIAIIVAGDLNDDPWSKTLQAIKRDLLVDLGDTLPATERFSYILDGNAVQLDHILLSANSNWSGSLHIIHLNSIFDHSVQTSDHDPVIAEFYLP